MLALISDDQAQLTQLEIATQRDAAINDRLAAISLSERATFHAAFAVRQIEIGFASMLCLLLGVTASLYGALLLVDHTYPRWLGGLAIAGGVPTVVAGVVIAYTGFSDLAMSINMPASVVLLLWMVMLGRCMWSRAEGRDE